MKTSIKTVIAAPVLISVLLLSGCATAGKNTLPSGGAMTMSAIYNEQTAGSNPPPARRSVRQKAAFFNAADTNVQMASNSTGAAQQTRGQFALLPNPAIPLHVYPHLIHNQAGTQPVPAYTSAFFLYRRNHFALPTEQY